MDPADVANTEIPHVARARNKRDGKSGRSGFQANLKNKSSKVVGRNRTDLQRHCRANESCVFRWVHLK